MDDKTTQDLPEAPASEETLHAEHPTPNAELSQDVAKLQRDVQTNLEGWQRSRAEFTNYKRRMEKELRDASDKGSHDTLKKLLPIIDDFARALANVPTELQGNSWVNGTALIMKKFDRLLEEFAVQEIDPVGQPFDPHKHEAIGADSDTDYASGIVTVTLQKGYVCGETVLRPALVRVAQ